jgi:hypothetical protein
VLLFVILFYVYPLKFVFVASVETITRRKNVITTEQAPTLFLVCGAGFAGGVSPRSSASSFRGMSSDYGRECGANGARPNKKCWRQRQSRQVDAPQMIAKSSAADAVPMVACAGPK